MRAETGISANPGEQGAANFDARRFLITPAALEAQPTAGDVFADDDIVLEAVEAHTTGEVHINSHVPAPVLGGFGRHRSFRRWRLSHNWHSFGRGRNVGILAGIALPEG